jgi:transcriptional regulator with XRE-family HTH domain
MAGDFKTRLRETRDMRKLSQSDLAERSGLQPSAISHFETGRRSPSFDNLRRLADALAVTIDYLLGRFEKPNTSGPRAEQMYRDWDNMSEADQEIVARFTAMLAEKEKKRSEDEP